MLGFTVEQVELDDDYYKLEAGIISAPVKRASVIYSGASMTCLISSIHPASSYTFRMSAHSRFGQSDFTGILLVHTPEDVPDRIDQLEAGIAFSVTDFIIIEPVSSHSARIRFPPVHTYECTLLHYNLKVVLVSEAEEYSLNSKTSYSNSYSTGEIERLVTLLPNVAALDNKKESMVISVGQLDPCCQYEFQLQSVSTVVSQFCYVLNIFRVFLSGVFARI